MIIRICRVEIGCQNEKLLFWHHLAFDSFCFYSFMFYSPNHLLRFNIIDCRWKQLQQCTKTNFKISPCTVCDHSTYASTAVYRNLEILQTNEILDGTHYRHILFFSFPVPFQKFAGKDMRWKLLQCGVPEKIQFRSCADMRRKLLQQLMYIRSFE